MSGPPRRPPGAPPARPPGLPAGAASFAQPAGAARGPLGQMPGGIQRPPGPPPRGGPVTAIKPPPMAPPPQMLQQTFQRPGVENVKAINSKKTPLSPKDVEEAPAKSPNFTVPKTAKEGAIAMFEEPDEASEPAEKKAKPTPEGPTSTADIKGPPRGPPRPMVPTADPSVPIMRQSKPTPPQANPPGIPEGQPLPPEVKPEVLKKPAPPIRPPPNRNRAPPNIDPEEEKRRRLAAAAAENAIRPPSSEPPLLRIKKAKEEPPMKRREKDMPEFEESDDEEEDPNFVKQPLPFGVLKEPLPKSSLAVEPPKQEPVLSPSQSVKSSISPSIKRVDDGASKSSAQTSRNDLPPPLAPVDTLTTELIPAAPAAMDKHYDDSKIGKSLTPGRLSIKVVEGYEIRRKDDLDRNPRNDPYLKFRLGAAERHPWKTSTVKRKQDTNPQFDDEIIFFDVLDPGQYIFQEDMQLVIELWNKSTMKDEKVGSVTMSVVRFLQKAFVSYVEKVPIYYPGAAKTTMKVLMEFVYEEARTGLLQITLYQARGLRNIDPMGHQDPYVQFSLGREYKKKSKVIKNGGTEPYFSEEDVLMWVDQDNWINDLQVDVLDEDSKEEKPIGSTHFSVLPYMKFSPDDAKEDIYDLFYMMLIDPKDDKEKKEVACGEIEMRVRFMPAGKLEIFVDRAKDLQFPESHKPIPNQVVRMDPYVNLTIEGKAVKMIKRTPADKDGGSDPIWENSIKFDIVDQYQMTLDVLNQNLIGKDELLGSANISLLTVFRNGNTEFWTTLKQRKANGGIREVGDIFVKLSFGGPIGIAYPQFRPEVDSFDDTLRKMPALKDGTGKDEEPEEMETKPIIETIPDEKENKAEAAKQVAKLQEEENKDQYPQEFTDEEIVNAFKFIDLDHNNFVGAREIRHILVCMGEMITDEEIDMMISMVDMDGDGQVSFKEFRTLVLHPNPGVVDMHKDVNRINDEAIMKEKQSLAGKVQGLDLTSFQRQKEMTTREVKKKMIISFVADNEVNFDYIRQSYTEYLELPKELRPNGRIKFPEFCSVLNIEPITEYKNLHAYYDTEELGNMDFREFLLSMMNFAHIDRDTRIKFSFQMFDEEKTGYISQKEVEEILRGNHMISIASVKRKADTIMKQANKNNSGSITLNEFIVVSKKFPNILLPAIGLNQVNGNGKNGHQNGNGNENKSGTNGNTNQERRVPNLPSSSTSKVPLLM